VTAAVRLEVRDLVMGPGIARDIPLGARVLMELRGGAAVTTIDGTKQERRPGDFWEVPKGSVLTIENPGDVAVIRAIYLYEGPQ